MDGGLAVIEEKKVPRRGVPLAQTACLAGFCGIAVLSVFEYIWYYPRILFAFFILYGISAACLRASGGAAKGEINADKDHTG